MYIIRVKQSRTGQKITDIQCRLLAFSLLNILYIGPVVSAVTTKEEGSWFKPRLGSWFVEFACYPLCGLCGFSFSGSDLLLQSKDMYVRSVLRKCTDVAFAVHCTAKSLQLYMKKCYSETINLLMQSFRVLNKLGLSQMVYLYPVMWLTCCQLTLLVVRRSTMTLNEPAQRVRSTG